MAHDRYTETRANLMKILERRGVIYTLGLLIGIIARRSTADWDIYKEIKDRAEHVNSER
jgi:hypothetical protein